MDSMSFAEQFEAIQKDRLGVVQSSVYPGIKELVSEIYPEEAHFIYELLQNAEDAGATSVYFEIQRTQLVFKHNGKKLFDAADVDSITNIAKSTKKENYVQAGKFGIGFKSVYAFTDTPSIYCDSVSFRIDQLLLPVQVKDIINRESGWTEFHFPFDSPKISAENARKKIRQGLVEIESTTLLFLNNITRLNYKLEDGSFSRVEKKVDGNIVTCTIAKSNNAAQFKKLWLRFSKDSSLDGKRVQVDIAFPMVYSSKLNKYSFVRETDKVCIKFLAKNEKSNLRFFINAPFGCTPSRDTVNKGDQANKALIKEIASLTAATITELKNTGRLSDDFFDILPLPEDNVPEFYQPIVKAITNAFSDHENLPTIIDGHFIRAENGIMSSRDVIDKIFTQEDIRKLFRSPKLCFVKNRAVNTRAYRFLKSLNIRELTPELVLVQMTVIGNKALVELLQSWSDEKLEDLYIFLCKGIEELEQQAEKLEIYKYYVSNDIFEYRRGSEEQKESGRKYLLIKQQLEKIHQLSIVRTIEGEFVVAENANFAEEGVDVPKELKIVKKELYKSVRARRFLKSIGVKAFTQAELQGYKYKNEINEMISYLARMQKIEYSRSAKPLDIARDILAFLSKHKIDEVKWDEYRIIYAKHSSRYASNWHRISECCLDKPLINETGFTEATSVHKKCIIDPVYMELEKEDRTRWIDFLKKNGVLWQLKVRSINATTGYRTGLNTDYSIDLLGAYLSLHSIALSRYIWKSLSTEGGWNNSYCRKMFKLNRNYSTKIEDSTVLSILKKTKWVPDRNGVFCLPRDISRETIDSSFVIDESNGFLSAIDFGLNAQKQKEEEQARKEKEFLEQAQQIEAAKRLGFDSTEAVLASKEDSKKVARLKSLGLDIDEIISNEEKKRKERNRKDIESLLSDRQDEKFKGARTSEYDPAAVVQNPDRSREKAKEALDQGPEESKKKISVRKDTKPNKEEKQFLYNQYGGKCQVCSKTIVKRDGTHYFEAINLMSTAMLEDKYLTGLDIGWNSLCLCPNCAAEYQYGAISLYDFKEKVMALTIDKNVDDYVEFSIKMQNESRILRYSPMHLFLLQTALKHFQELSDNDTDLDTEKESSINEHGRSATLIKKISAGDHCPDCGKQKNHAAIITVLDKNGEPQQIQGIVCDCGTTYLTRNMFNKLNNANIFNIVDARSTAATKKSGNSTGQNNTNRKGKVILVSSSKKDEPGRRCRSCGKVGEIFRSGLCWNCYKEDMQATYDY